MSVTFTSTVALWPGQLSSLWGYRSEIGRNEKLSKIVGDVLQDNAVMRRVCEKLGFKLEGVPDEPVMKAEIAL